MAESFGENAGQYDAARPGYPDALIARIVAGMPAPDDPARPDVLDVGCGTGIAARQFQAAGCLVLGVEPDPRMAAFAQARGLPVEVATFEAWEPAGRTFNAVVAAQSWHWVDPAAGAARAAEVLRPGGRLAVFGHVYEPPPEVAEPFAAAFRRAVPDSPLSTQPARRPLDAYQALYATFADAIRDTGSFDAPEHWRYDWQRPYTRDEWLALLPTTGGLTRLTAAQLSVILSDVGTAIDALGGAFTMPFTTLATTAVLLS
ncbi:class I SAM-dependent methyltransferase [Streptomyces sp. NRRL F-5123]|uniref:class I SAM-dependent methyltransferase n=1 Tax=Streptomyces sp. NRRL F-5123 TaxID=1463856 RepID=UPI0004E1DA10|nr:class I SAM-dependent methyltransferase [Streptomyces sp. NRRL F-5123]